MHPITQCFLMWVMLVQASRGTSGLTFHGSWHPEHRVTIALHCQENISATFVQVVQLIQTCYPVVASILLTRPVSPAQGSEVLLVKGK